MNRFFTGSPQEPTVVSGPRPLIVITKMSILGEGLESSRWEQTSSVSDSRVYPRRGPTEGAAYYITNRARADGGRQWYIRTSHHVWQKEVS